MGVGGSKQGADYMAETENINDWLPVELMEEVLTQVDAKTVLRKCSLVCRRWSSVTRNPRFWLRRCVEDGVTIPSPSTRSQHLFSYARLFVHRPFDRNHIVNGSGELGDLRGWNVASNLRFGGWHGSEMIQVEQPPVGCENTETSTCFATSYQWGVKRQIVHLNDVGIDSQLINHGRLRVTATEEFTARWDCSGVYRLELFLLARSTDQNGKKRQKRPQNDYTIIKCKRVEVDEFQMERNVWQSTMLSMNIDNPHVIAVMFESAGKDGQFWAGNYGAKMYNARLTFECDVGDDRPEVGDENTDAKGENFVWAT